MSIVRCLLAHVLEDDTSQGLFAHDLKVKDFFEEHFS